MLIAAFTAACAKEHLTVKAAITDGAVEITSAVLGAGADAGVTPWAVIKAVAPDIFDECTSVAAAKGADAANWRKFIPTARPPTSMLIAAFTALAPKSTLPSKQPSPTAPS